MRLLSLPKAGLKMQEVRFKAALDALNDSAKTTVILVTRPDKGAIDEATRTSSELKDLGLNNQRLAINGVFHASERTNAVANAIENLGQQALDGMPKSLRELPQDRVPLRAFDTACWRPAQATPCWPHGWRANASRWNAWPQAWRSGSSRCLG